PLHRLDQVDLGLGAHGRDDDTRKTRTGTDVRNQTRHRKKGHHGSGVEDVAVPDARHLTWTDESPQFSLVTEPLGESIDRGERVAEVLRQLLPGDLRLAVLFRHLVQ